MTREEKQTQIRFATLEQQVSAVATKVDLLVEESKKQREDIKQAQAKHDADMKAAQAKHEADMKDLHNEIQGSLKHIQQLVLASMGLTVAAVVGIVAITVATWVFMLTSLSNRDTPSPAQPSAAQYQHSEQATR